MERATPEAEASLRLLHKIRFGSSPAEPVVFLVHGRRGNFDVMATFRRCFPDSWTLISVQAILPEANGFSWWDISNPSPRGDIDHAYEVLRDFLTKACPFYGLTSTKKFAVGFSQGAALLSIYLQRSPAELTGVGLLAGFVFSDKKKREDFTVLPKIFIAHGTTDEVVPISKAKDGMKYLEQIGSRVTFVEDTVGHKVGVNGMNRLKEWVLDEGC